MAPYITGGRGANADGEIDMANLRTAIIAITSVLLVAGCTSKFRSDVASFHRLQAPSGESVQIVAKDPGKRGSIEFAQYASLVGEGLWKLGYQPAGVDEKPDLIVRVDYRVGEARAQIRSYGGYGGYGYGSYGFGHHGFGHHGLYGPYGYGYPHHQDIRSYTIYDRVLEMEIAKADNPDINIFESRVISEGRSNRLTEIMPLMVRSMFQEFPGPSGVTREVSIELDKNSGY